MFTKVMHLGLVLLLAAACNEAGFSGKPASKSTPQQLQGPMNTNDALPEVDCTGKTAKECRDAKPSPDTPTFRKVDCAGKSQDECETAKQQEKNLDKDKSGDLGSDIRVVNDENESDGNIDLGNSEVVKSGSFVCIGGVGRNIAYVVKTKELAQKCLDFGNSQPCLNDSKCDNMQLQIFDCYCNNQDGIPFQKTNQCYRYNPLKGSTVKTGCVAK